MSLFNILIYERTLTSANGAFIEDIGNRITNYTHTISATCGYESMSVSLVGTITEAIVWTQRLFDAVQVYDAEAREIWEGYLTRVDYTYGQETRSMSLDAMANRVRVRYTTSADTPGTTTPISDTASQAIYGIKDSVLSLNKTTATAAGNIATAELARRKNPACQPTSEVRTGDSPNASITLAFAGWYSVLDWLVTSNTSTTSTVTTTQVGALLTAYVAVNPFLSTSMLSIAASGISDTEYIDTDTPYRQKIEDLLRQGTSAGQRLAWGIYNNREMMVATWAGATPTTIQYRRALGDGILSNGSGAIVEPWNVVPDTMYSALDLLDASPSETASDTAATFYIERVTFRADESGYGVTIEPQESDALDARLARTT